MIRVYTLPVYLHLLTHFCIVKSVSLYGNHHNYFRCPNFQNFLCLSYPNTSVATSGFCLAAALLGFLWACLLSWSAVSLDSTLKYIIKWRKKYLTLKEQRKNSADNTFFFFYFYPLEKIRIGVLCESSAQQRMRGYSLFLLRNKKNCLWIILNTQSYLELWSYFLWKTIKRNTQESHLLHLWMVL